MQRDENADFDSPTTYLSHAIMESDMGKFDKGQEASYLLKYCG